jgi:hypothetical protein
MSTTYIGSLERVWIEGEENGWELCFETEHGIYRANAHGVAHGGELVDQLHKAAAEISSWWNAGRQAAREHGVDLAAKDEGGYDPDDPKSPGYHDRMVGDA